MGRIFLKKAFNQKGIAQQSLALLLFLSRNGQTKIYGCFVNRATDVALKIFHTLLIGRGAYTI
jgi:hypothetical protein